MISGSSDETPASTKTCIRRWPISSVAPVNVGQLAQYRGYLSDELVLETEMQRMSLIDSSPLRNSLYALYRDTVSSAEIQSIQLRECIDPGISRASESETGFGTSLIDLARRHPAGVASAQGAEAKVVTADECYTKLFSYIRKSNKTEKSMPLLDPVKAQKDRVVDIPIDMPSRRADNSAVLKRSIADVEIVIEDTKRSRSSLTPVKEPAHPPVSLEPTEETVSVNGKTLEESTSTMHIGDTAVSPVAEKVTAAEQPLSSSVVASDAPAMGDSAEEVAPPWVEKLDEYLAKLFQEDDALSDNSSMDLTMFRRVQRLNGDSVVVSKRAIRQIKGMLVPCSPEQLQKFISEDSTARLIRLLGKAVEVADSMGLADMIKSGSAMEQGTGISASFCTQLELAISISSLGLEAASLVIGIIASGKAAKGAYTEDSLHSAAAFFKECSLNCVVPLLDLPPSNSLVAVVSDKRKPLKNRLHTFLGLILAAHEPIVSALNQLLLAEQDVISLVFVSITIMFTASELAGSSLDKNLLESIRRSAQTLLQYIFERHIEQRSWILEEILGSLIRLPVQKRSQGSYRIASGKSVQFISILLLKLLQGTARPPDDLTAGFEGGTLPTKEYRILLDKHHKSIEAAASSTDFAIRYLIGRCIRRDNKPALNEADYRNLLESFIDDCITLLGHPQWPASELVVRIYSMHLIDVLDEDKSDFAMKSLALDGLAQIAAHIARAQRESEISAKDGGLGTLAPVAANSSLDTINTFASTTTLLLEYLQSKALSEESTGAIPLYIGGWATALISALIKSRQRRRSNDSDEGMEGSPAPNSADGQPGKAGTNGDAADESESDGDDDSDSDNDGDMDVDDGLDSDYEDGNAKRHKSKSGFGAAERKVIEECLKEYTSVTHRSTKAMPSHVSYGKAAGAARAIFGSLPLYRSFDMIVSRMAMSLGSSLVTVRSKALRALNHVASHRPSVLYQPSVKFAINHRLQDNSSLVREAAIDLIGKHVAQNPELTSQYYDFISVRALDKGTSVRKRVIRILRDIYLASDDQSRLVDIGVRVLQRTSDEERSIREFALKTLQELWFSYSDTDTIADDQAALGSSANIFNSLAPDVQRQMMKRVRVMTGVMEATRSRELSELMGVLFEHATREAAKTEADAAMLVTRCIIDALFEQLLRSEETESASVFSTSACLRFLSALSGIAPEAVGARAEMLSAYLKMTSPAEEEMLTNTLHIFQNSMLMIPHPSPQFLSTLESDLISLLSSSPQSILVEAVPCLCTVVEKLTRDNSRILRLFRSCILQLYRERRLLEGGAAAMQSPRNAMRFMILAGLLCRHFDFDKHRTELEAQFKEAAQLAKGMPVPEFMCNLLLFFAAPGLPATVQLAAIQMLGQLYIKRPQLALSAAGREVVDRVFAGSIANHKLQVMRNFLEFLRDDAQRYVQKAKEAKTNSNGKGKGGRKKKVDARALVGNTDDMGEAGVGASLMQTYLERIIDATFVPNAPLLRAAGFEVISLVLEQGLAHPLMCVPALIALSTDSDPHIRTKSLKLHQDLAGKHASFIHSRDIEGVRKSFEYQSQVRGGPQNVSGYNDNIETTEAVERPIAFLQPLYTMLRSKRSKRNDFLVMLVNIGDVDGTIDGVTATAIGTGVPNQHLVRFVAENISALDFKYLDEVLLVAYQISSVIAGTGLTLHQLFETEGCEGVECESARWRAATEASVSITILFMLREFLKAHYGVTEARCSGFSPGDTSSTVRDKSVAWHVPTSSQTSLAGRGRIDWSACAWATVGLGSPETYKEQRKLFRKMMASSLAVIDELAPMDNNNSGIGNGDRSRNNSVASDAANDSFTSDVSLNADVLEQLANEDILE